VSQAFQRAHELGMATVLWCYLRNRLQEGRRRLPRAADLTGQANHLGVTIEADIIKQKLPLNNGGFNCDLKFGKTHKRSTASSRPTTRSTCALPDRELLHGPRGLINSGGASGENDLRKPCARRSSTSARAAWA
jgi:class I fructose-bisphosphate aldolase